MRRGGGEPGDRGGGGEGRQHERVLDPEDRWGLEVLPYISLTNICFVLWV